MQRCETCRFWHPEKIAESSWSLKHDFDGFGTCEAVVEYEAEEASWPPNIEHIYVQFEDPMSGPNSYTGSRFSCIHWRKKQRED